MAVTAVGRGFRFAIKEPIATAWEMGPQAAITTASVYMVAEFGMAHNILPWWIAVPMAIGFEWTWLRGIRTAGLVRRGGESERWINLLTKTALITVIAYGILFIIGLSSFGIIPEHPGQGWGIILALAKVIPIALMGYASANLHRVHKQQVMTDADAREKENRERLTELQAQQDALEIDRRRRESEIELDRQRKAMELEMWQKGLEVKRAMRQPHKVSHPVGRKRPVVIDGIEYESRAAAAAALGITPQAVSKRAKAA